MTLRIFAAFVVGAAASESLDAEGACAVADSDGCPMAVDEASLLQHKFLKTDMQTDLQASSGSCPGSNTMCNGNQCCPGVAASGMKTFPCPSAEYGWNRCEGEHPSRPQPTTTSKPVQRQQCPFSNQRCYPNTCCTGVRESEWKSFPCPGSDSDFDNCDTEAPDECDDSKAACFKDTCCAARHGFGSYPCPSSSWHFKRSHCDVRGPWMSVSEPETTTTSKLVASNQCPFSYQRCQPNSCCTGVQESKWKSFPCPGSDSGFNQCDTEAPNECPDTKAVCFKNTCCAANKGQGFGSYPCPGSGRRFRRNRCEVRGAWTPVAPAPAPTPAPSLSRRCPWSGTACQPNSCCPGVAASNGKTFPCPGSDSWYNQCERMQLLQEESETSEPAKQGA